MKALDRLHASGLRPAVLAVRCLWLAGAMSPLQVALAQVAQDAASLEKLHAQVQDAERNVRAGQGNPVVVIRDPMPSISVPVVAPVVVQATEQRAAASSAPVAAPVQAMSKPKSPKMDPELAIDVGIEASAAGPGLVFSIAQTDWLYKADVMAIGMRFSEALTTTQFTYTVPTDMLGATAMVLGASYTLSHPAYNVETSPRYRNGHLGATWFYPYSHDWIGSGWTAYWGIRQEISSISSRDPALQTFYDTNGRQSKYLVPNIGLNRSKREGQYFLSPGHEDRWSMEMSLNGEPQRYWRSEYKREQFWELGQDLTLQGRFSYGLARSMGGAGAAPLGKRFVSTGNDVRGYEVGTIGPTDPGGNPIGGLRKVTASAEAYLKTFPLFDQPVYMSVFADTARFDKSDVGSDAQRTYAGYGMGFLWNAPSGAIKLNLGFPVGSRPGDRLQRFSFEFKAYLR